MSRLNEIKAGGNWTLHMIDNKFLKLRAIFMLLRNMFLKVVV